jgi:hypothetical protein
MALQPHMSLSTLSEPNFSVEALRSDPTEYQNMRLQGGFHICPRDQPRGVRCSRNPTARPPESCIGYMGIRCPIQLPPHLLLHLPFCPIQRPVE